MINEFFVTEQLIISPNINVCQVLAKDIVFNRIGSLVADVEAVAYAVWHSLQSAREYPSNHLPEVAVFSQCDYGAQM
jgi:hypothetical protein